MASVTDRLPVMQGILLRLSLLQRLCTVQWDLLYGWCEHLFVSELNNEYFTTQIFQNIFLSG